MDCKRSAIVHDRDRDDPVRFAVIVTGSIAADRGNTAAGSSRVFAYKFSSNPLADWKQKAFRVSESNGCVLRSIHGSFILRRGYMYFNSAGLKVIIIGLLCELEYMLFWHLVFA